MKYFHVDVFSSRALGGNGLAVVFPDRAVDDATLQSIAREFNQFETAFIYPPIDGAFPVRIFTVDEELPFAGHPLLGSAAMIHRSFFPSGTKISVTILLGGRKVSFESALRTENGRPVYSETMHQGSPSFISRVCPDHSAAIAASLGLTSGDIDSRYPVEVVSTGLPYLLVPLASGIDRARISGSGFERFLSGFGAKFAYIFDTATLECRTWDNDGRVEDVATGSAAGPLCAWLVKNGLRKSGEVIHLSQGRFAGRPSEISGWVKDGAVYIRGDVALFAAGEVQE